jgi:hypothetical protein
MPTSQAKTLIAASTAQDQADFFDETRTIPAPPGSNAGLGDQREPKSAGAAMPLLTTLQQRVVASLTRPAGKGWGSIPAISSPSTWRTVCTCTRSREQGEDDPVKPSHPGGCAAARARRRVGVSMWRQLPRHACRLSAGGAQVPAATYQATPASSSYTLTVSS